MTISGTDEWASTNENFLFGCQHDCRYCYAKCSSPRHKKIDIHNWATPIVRQDELNKGFGKRKGTTMFPSTHDIHPDNLPQAMEFIYKMLKPGNNLLIVSKPHVECISRICDAFILHQEQILFRFTIGSANSAVLKFWEPNAPDFLERLSALQIAYKKGYKTSVSCEPMLDNHIEDVVDQVQDYVTDSIWLGKMNQASKRCKINGHDDTTTMKILHQLEEWQDDAHILTLYHQYKKHKKIKWKDSIKEVVGITRPTEKGLDI